jgi:selenocysteine lyase/cysteine desulfurase
MVNATVTTPALETKWEQYFKKYRENVVGHSAQLQGPYGPKTIIYADWIASGRLYQPIEEKMSKELGPYVANTHTETSYTGALMTRAYSHARGIIKRHANATNNDVLITCGTGMTGAVLKLQRILGLKIPEQFKARLNIKEAERPVVFISHMEHHSNQTSWLETIATVEVIQANADGLLDLEHLKFLLEKYQERPFKVASITSASNVTGVFTPYHQVAKLMHAQGGWCFVDFACSGPYVDIDMHPANADEKLDAIFFSPHKFLGGPGTPGILIFNKELYKNKVPDHPGGGTVSWTNPWGGHAYFTDIEVREDGGTPGFLQTMRAAMVMRLKEEMTTEAIEQREENIINYVLHRLKALPNLHVLAGNITHRLGAISFFIDDCHYNLAVSLLNDLHGIQTRGGCSCAGTYGHYLLEVTEDYSNEITNLINHGDDSLKPGWVRLSLHPVMSNQEIKTICEGIENVAKNWRDYGSQYYQPKGTNEFKHKSNVLVGEDLLKNWFS